ncbi:MAG: peptidase C39 family protein [Elusimicrobia bacterium]|nr:peptidase C39 family protein [Elusimicrobiota bacterium]
MLTGLLSACSHRRPAHSPPSEEAKQVHLKTPFYTNQSAQCGPAALASVLAFYGKKTAPERIREAIYRDDLNGSLSVDMLLAAQSYGMSAEMLEGGLHRLKAELDAGHPLIAFLNLGTRLTPIGHYVVVTGYDDARQGVLAHSGTKQDGLISYARFSRQWEKTDRWALLVLPDAR